MIKDFQKNLKTEEAFRKCVESQEPYELKPEEAFRKCVESQEPYELKPEVAQEIKRFTNHNQLETDLKVIYQLLKTAAMYKSKFIIKVVDED